MAPQANPLIQAHLAEGATCDSPSAGDRAFMAGVRAGIHAARHDAPLRLDDIPKRTLSAARPSLLRQYRVYLVGFAIGWLLGSWWFLVLVGIIAGYALATLIPQ